MKRKQLVVSVVLLSLFLWVCGACASNQASAQTATQVASGKDRIVELYVPGCG